MYTLVIHLHVPFVMDILTIYYEYDLTFITAYQ